MAQSGSNLAALQNPQQQQVPPPFQSAATPTGPTAFPGMAPQARGLPTRAAGSNLAGIGGQGSPLATPPHPVGPGPGGTAPSNGLAAAMNQGRSMPMAANPTPAMAPSQNSPSDAVPETRPSAAGPVVDSHGNVIKNYDPNSSQGFSSNADDSQAIAGGLFGMGTDYYNKYDANPNAYVDHTLDANKAALAASEASLQAQPTQQMSSTHAGITQIDPALQQNDRAAGQALTSTLGDQLQQEMAGGGAVQQASRAQLQAGTDQTIATQMAMAASQQGGNPMLAMRGAMGNAATAQQQEANAAAGLTAQNAMGAQQQLQGVAGLDQSQGAQDLGLATQQAAIENQGSQFNAGADNSTSATNLASAVQQKQFIDTKVAELQAEGLSLDQAQFQAKQAYAKQEQDSMAQQEAAKHGVSVQTQGQASQSAGAALAATAAMVAAAA